MSKEEVKKPSYEDLKAEVERLQGALAEQTSLASEAQKRAAIFQSAEQEAPTGKTVMTTRVKNYKVSGYHDDGRQILRPEWHEVEEPTFWYTIDMPAVGGVAINLNGKEFYHGQTYEVTVDELRTLKDIVHRLWMHERSIHEDNTEVFRKHYDNRLRKFFPKGEAVTPAGKKVKVTH